MVGAEPPYCNTDGCLLSHLYPQHCLPFTGPPRSTLSIPPAPLTLFLSLPLFLRAALPFC